MEHGDNWNEDDLFESDLDDDFEPEDIDEDDDDLDDDDEETDDDDEY